MDAEMHGLPVALWVMLFIAGWLIFFHLVVGLLSLIGGWYRLAKLYPDKTSGNIVGVQYSFQSVIIRYFVSYRYCVYVAISERGISLRIFFLFRFLHRPIFIEWNEMLSVNAKSMLFYRGVEIVTRHAKIFIAGKSAEQILRQHSEKHQTFTH